MYNVCKYMIAVSNLYSKTALFPTNWTPLDTLAASKVVTVTLESSC